jgi:hypothetical protein
MNLQTLGLGKILAIIGLILTVIFIAISRLAIFPEGALFALAFLAMLL